MVILVECCISIVLNVHKIDSMPCILIFVVRCFFAVSLKEINPLNVQRVFCVVKIAMPSVNEKYIHKM